LQSHSALFVATVLQFQRNHQFYLAVMVKGPLM
jgi:hypothetical protein